MGKKLISILLAAAMCTACAGMVVSAAAESPDTELVQPFATVVSKADSKLSISGATATCISEGVGNNTVTQIIVNQTLQRQTSSGSWQFVAHWNATRAASNIYLSNTKSALTDGTYRLYSVYTFFTSSGFEKAEKYSTYITIP